MDRRHIDLNLFRVFQAIHEEGSLTRAGEVLHMTQPAVSNALARLRGTYGDPLFVRNASGMTPTPLAATIAGDVRKALRLLTESIETADVFDAQNSDRRFRILAGDLNVALLMPKVLARVGALAPGVSTEIIQLERSSMVHDLASGQVDLALDALPLSDPQIISLKVMEDPYVCAVRRDHPVIRRRITLKQYLSMGHAHASSRRRGLGQVDLALRRLGKQRTIAARTQHHLGLPHIVAKTNLLASIPRSLAEAYDLNVLKLPFDIPPAEIYACWHKSTDSDSANRWLRGVIVQNR
ncbi:MAG: LysR family transcriptional regulator [Gammaproteobacteria bacterium]|nr:LysR family transcriptional regulator [Gammaproteobacteria bacterium]MCZ6774236.1 LysR family transcriptional regulator [Pseudomonadota bacterium]